MATERDYYELLGVARDADDATIKKAFRRLARQLHPDVSNEPDAELRFREVTEAYEVLASSETRALYDRYGHAGLRSGGFRPTQFDVGGLADIFSAFFGDDLFSARGPPPRRRCRRDRRDRARRGGPGRHGDSAVRGRRVPARRVAAMESSPGTTPVRCTRCDGTGRLQHVTRSVLGQFVRTQACPQCAGRGVVIEHPCQTCDGAGLVVDRREREVEMPAGIHDGQRIRLSGEGHAGESGGRAGDVYVRVRVKPDPRFVREGNDIYSQVDVTIVEAAIGATHTVETLDGPIELELEPGTQPGDVKVLRGKGMPVLQGFGRGDHRVLVNVTVPTTAQRRPAAPAARVRGCERRRHLSARRELLRQAEERVPLIGLRRVSVQIGSDRAEEARATMIELFPEGFEEVERATGVELAAYTDAAGEERIWHVFSGAQSPTSRTAGRTAGAPSTVRSASVGSGSGRRGRRRRTTCWRS